MLLSIPDGPLSAEQVSQCSIGQLMKVLERQGWTWQQAPKRIKDRSSVLAIVPTIFGGVMMQLASRSRSNKLTRSECALALQFLKSCLLCLANAQRLFSSKRVKQILHNQRPEYYEQVIDLSNDGTIAITDKAAKKTKRSKRAKSRVMLQDEGPETGPQGSVWDQAGSRDVLLAIADGMVGHNAYDEQQAHIAERFNKCAVIIRD